MAVREIADAVNRAPSTIYDRISALKESGALRGIHAEFTTRGEIEQVETWIVFEDTPTWELPDWGGRATPERGAEGRRRRISPEG